MKQIANIKTPKAERLMKALCNHFARKTTASYEGEHGEIHFQDGRCDLSSSPTTLTLQVEAENLESLDRLTQVVAKHLSHFTPDEELTINWGDPI